MLNEAEPAAVPDVTPPAAASGPPDVTAEAFERLRGQVHEIRPNEDLAPLVEAYQFANRQHYGQLRASGEPYMTHPVEVAHILANMRMDMVSLQTGLLHDVVEDTSVTVEEIRKKFGPEVARCVDGVTKLAKFDFFSAEDRQAESFRKMLLAMVGDIRVILIKLADRLHNMRTLGSLSVERQERIARETLEIYAPIAHRLGMGKVRGELEDLAFRYMDPSAWAEISNIIEEKRAENERLLEYVKTTVEGELRREGIPARIEGRIKRAFSVYEKLKRQKITVDRGLRPHGAPHHYGFGEELLRGPRESFTTNGTPSQDASRTSSPSRVPISINPCILRCWGPKDTTSKSRSARKKCTAWPKRASPRTGSTRKARRVRSKTISASSGCATWSNGSRTCRIPASSCRRSKSTCTRRKFILSRPGAASSCCRAARRPSISLTPFTPMSERPVWEPKSTAASFPCATC